MKPRQLEKNGKLGKETLSSDALPIAGFQWTGMPCIGWFQGKANERINHGDEKLLQQRLLRIALKMLRHYL